MADGAATHTRQPVFTAGAAIPKMISETFKGRTVPGFLDGVDSQVYRPSPGLIVKTTGEHFHIRSDVGRPAGPFAGIDAVHIDFN